MSTYRPSDPYEWGTQGVRPAPFEHEDRGPFQAPPVPKEDDDEPQIPPPPPPEPREWVMEGYIPELWRELLAGARDGKRAAQSILERITSHVRIRQVQEPESPQRQAPLGPVEEREAPEHG